MPEIPSRVLEHASRNRAMSELIVPCASYLSTMIDVFEVDEMDLGLVVDRAALKGGADNGIQELYYAGLYSWIIMRESIDSEVLEQSFEGPAAEVVDNFTFRDQPANLMDGVLQSSLSSPTVFAGWFSVAGNEFDFSRLHWDMYHNVPREEVIRALESDWFPRILRDASRTSSGLYRNGTGYHMDYRRFVARSLQGPLKKYYDARQDGEFPISITHTDGSTEGTLSDDFREYLSARLKDHNRSVGDNAQNNAPLHVGSSQGCPFSNGVHVISDRVLVPDGVGRITSRIEKRGMNKVQLTLDLYAKTTKFLAGILRKLPQ